MTTIFGFQAPKHGTDLEEELKEHDTHPLAWSSARPPLRTAVPELGWVDKGALGSSYAESEYGPTAYLCCCGAILGDDLDDVVWIDWFWSDIALRRVWGVGGGLLSTLGDFVIQYVYSTCILL